MFPAPLLCCRGDRLHSHTHRQTTSNTSSSSGTTKDRTVHVCANERVCPGSCPSPGPVPDCIQSRGSSQDPIMDPAVLIFLLYMMIAHELVCGWMQYRKQSGRARARTGPPLRSRLRVCPGVWRASSQSLRSDRVRELRKSGRIVRKA